MVSFRKAKTEAPEESARMPRSVVLSKGTFFGESVPEEAREAVSLLHLLSPEALRSPLQHIAALLKGDVDGISDEQFMLSERKMLQKIEGFHPSESFDGVKYGVLFSGLYSMLRSAVRSKTPRDVLQADLVKMNVPKPVVEDMVRVVQAIRQEAENCAVSNRIRCPRLQQLRWRVDVIISSGSLSRVMRPTILMQFYLSNGSIKSFEVSIEQFHQMRFCVAKVLSDMQQLERHPIMRIVNEFEKKDKEARNK